MEDLTRLCERRHVRRLALFGSAVADNVEPHDLDFSVEFDKMTPGEHADCYLDLLEDLQQMFKTKIDLIEPGPIKNPYFLKDLQNTQVVVYHAA